MHKISAGVEVCNFAGAFPMVNYDHPPGVLFRRGRGSHGFADFRFELFEESPTLRILVSLYSTPMNCRGVTDQRQDLLSEPGPCDNKSKGSRCTRYHVEAIRVLLEMTQQLYHGGRKLATKKSKY